MRRPSARGFTLIELLIAVTIVGALSTLSIFAWRAAERHLALSRAARVLQSQLRRARSLSATAPEAGAAGAFSVPDTGGAVVGPRVVPNLRMRFGGLRVTGPREVSLFADADRQWNGNEIVLERRALAERTDIALEAPDGSGPATFRFARDGTLVPGAPARIRIVDPRTGRNREIEVQTSGLVRVL